jgi:predicted metal-dependent enzyme (double-stranded beta helix superfamily)
VIKHDRVVGSDVQVRRSDVFDVEAFVADCRAALAESQSALAVKELVERAVSSAREIDAALGTANEGGLRTLHRAQDLTVLQFVWPPGVELFPHDHRMWAANGIYAGIEENAFFRRRDRGLERAGGKSLRAGEVALLGTEAIHAVANPSSSYTAAIHVYGGDFFGTARSQWDPETLTEAPFDVEAVRRVLVDADTRARRSQT